jgi:hypothetical protein
MTQMQEGEDDEDIPSNDTTTPTAQQGPMTRARARQLNYQVKSFLALKMSSSLNGVLLKSCDDFLMLRNMGEEPDDSSVDVHFRHQDLQAAEVCTSGSDIKFGQPGWPKLLGPYFLTPKVV